MKNTDLAMSKNTLCSLFAVIALTACSSPPPQLHYYLLDQDVAAYQLQGRGNLTSVSLEQVKLARYLQQSQLAILNGHTLSFSSQDVWAEELRHGISRSLVNDFNLSRQYRLQLPSQPGENQPRYQLQLQVDHLVATDDGKVILAGQYWIMDQGKVAVHKSFYLEQALKQDGFEHAVSLQRKTLSSLAQEMIGQLTALGQ